MDLMIDIETLGAKPGCKILTIGACLFDMTLPLDQDPTDVTELNAWKLGQSEFPDLKIQSSFYCSIDKDMQEGDGYNLVEEPDTSRWWRKQSEEAKEAAFAGKYGPLEACLSFMD